MNPYRLLSVMALVLLLFAWPRATSSQEKKGRLAWTLDQAREQLQLHPHDPYLQYVALQLARREGNDRVEQVASEIEELLGFNDRRRDRRDQVDLFSIFSGALAVQESLQLDAMAGERRGRLGQRPPFPEDLKQEPKLEKDPGKKELRKEAEPQPPPPVARNQKEKVVDPRVKLEQRRQQVVNVSELVGPTVKSHPWQKMLAGKQPAVSPLALLVPEDFYFVEFRSVNKLMEALEMSDLWAIHLFNQATREARTQGTGERLKQQLAIETNPLVRPFYDLVISEVAVTGSDLFVREGNDVTLLFRAQQPALFKARMDGFLANAEKAHSAAKRHNGEYQGVKYVQLATPDRELSVISAYPAADLHVRSNSLAGFQRVIDAIRGKTPQGRVVRRLGDTAEFAYIRTLFPRGAKEEDGFVYLSDPFIRKLIGPQTKLTQRRRMLCYNHLRMIGHAGLLYRTEHGKPADSLDTLIQANCCPKFNEGGLVCLDGGKYRLSADGSAGVCSHHGHAHYLTPCSEAPVTKVRGDEADEYHEFLEEYNRYWRTFFDPIALRIQITPEHYRLETVVLPLIDNSIYTGLATALGGQPEPLDALPVPKRNIFSVSARFDKDRLLKMARDAELDRGIPGLFREFGIRDQGAEKLDVVGFLAKGLGNQVSLHVYDAEPMFDFNLPGFMGLMVGSFNGGARGLGGEELLISFLVASLNSPVYIALPVQDTQVVDRFLGQLDPILARLARMEARGGFVDFSYDFYQTALAGDQKRPLRSFGVRVGPVKWRFFWARIGGGLYVASKRVILEDLAARDANPPRNADRGPAAHAMVRIRPQHWNQVLPDYRLGWAENHRQACLNNQGPLSSVARAFTPALGKLDDAELAKVSARIREEADRLHTVHFFCPEGGQYALAADGQSMACTVHGAPLAPRQPLAPVVGSSFAQAFDRLAELTATLTFLEDGLHAVVTIQRKSP